MSNFFNLKQTSVSAKLAIKHFFIIIFTILISLLISMWIYDPLQIFHKPFFRESAIYAENMHLASKNIIDNYEFDSIILGSSMLQATSGVEAGKKMGGLGKSHIS